MFPTHFQLTLIEELQLFAIAIVWNHLPSPPTLIHPPQPWYPPHSSQSAVPPNNMTVATPPLALQNISITTVSLIHITFSQTSMRDRRAIYYLS